MKGIGNNNHHRGGIMGGVGDPWYGHLPTITPTKEHLMKRVTMYQTYDGELHTTEKLATHHLKKLYGDALSTLSHQLVTATDGYYGKTVEFLDTHLEDFRLLLLLKEDMVVDNPEEPTDE